MFKFDNTIYSNEEFIYKISSSRLDKQRGRNKIEYYNIACSFDIETSSFYYNNDKASVMYIWQICVNGFITIGRTWEEFVELLNKLSRVLGCKSNERHLIIYVHNLAYEFQFMRKWFVWDKVFSLTKRKPLKAVTNTGIEFRCSYLLSGYSLEKVGEELTKYKVTKKVGQLDYDLVRTKVTSLTEKEIEYCVDDVKVVVAYIQEKIENEGGIIKIPLTKTGYVRNYCREKCLYRENSKTHSRNSYYRDLMKTLTIEEDEYHFLKQAFQGGFTHANYNYVATYYNNKIEKNVTSKDFTSSYPAVILSEKFPMSKGKKVYPKDEEEFRDYLSKYCCVFFITMHDVSQKRTVYENPISSSRCIIKSGGEVLSKDIRENNGRVYYAEQISMIITEIDFEIYEAFYDIGSIDYDEVVMYIYNYGYLPKPIIESTLDFYEKKTTLKDVQGKEVEYMLMKGNLNSIYGMMVTDICRDEILYDGSWSSEEPNLEKQLDTYNNSTRRFLFYPWGIYITAYARRNLFSGILELKNDYIYSDTDSVKFMNLSSHLDYFERYNKHVTEKIEDCLNFYNIDINRAKPKTIEGIQKPIGVWDDDGFYTRFKTLGAKRYLVEYESKGKLKHKLTVAGLGKVKGMEYLENNFKDVFDGFNDEMHVPPESTGKMTHTYLDFEDGEFDALVTDYMGNKCRCIEKSAIHLESCSFDLSLSEQFANFLAGVVDVEF